MDKIVVGLTEKVVINGREVIARIDTGAHRSSICKELYSKLNLGPFVGKIKIKNVNSVEVRPTVEAELEIQGKRIRTLFNVADRSKMKYPLLIGQDVLKRGFLVDPSK
ncbi:MAG: RimK/LysX family protein [Candidatus Nanoarchaeia archaeon]